MTQAQALTLSLVIEVPVLWCLARAANWLIPTVRLVMVGAAATLLTHPVVWHGTRDGSQWAFDWWTWVALTEVGATTAEAVLFWWFFAWTPRRAGLASVVANAASFGVGLGWVYGLRPWLGWVH